MARILGTKEDFNDSYKIIQFAMQGIEDIIKEKHPKKVKIKLGNIHVTLQQGINKFKNDCT